MAREDQHFREGLEGGLCETYDLIPVCSFGPAPFARIGSPCWNVVDGGSAASAALQLQVAAAQSIETAASVASRYLVQTIDSAPEKRGPKAHERWRTRAAHVALANVFSLAPSSSPKIRKGYSVYANPAPVAQAWFC